MELLIYVFHPDDTSLLVQELADLDEAIDLCHDLVEVDGYVRAEVWNDGGDRLYGIGYTAGGLRVYAEVPRSGPPPVKLTPPGTASVRHSDVVPGHADRDAPPGEPAADGDATAPAVDRAASPGGQLRILGDAASDGVQWFGG